MKTFLAFFFLPLALALGADDAAIVLKPSRPLPIQEVTAFKDGHAFVIQEGELPASPSGEILLDRLPTPVIGTFWPYLSDTNGQLKGVVASQRRVVIEKSALDLRELLEANRGQEAMISEGTNRYAATILGFTERPAVEIELNDPLRSPLALPQRGSLVLLKTAEGTRATPVEKITDVTFLKELKTRFGQEELRNLLTWQVDWKRGIKKDKARVGLMYLQKGFRWIPSYKVNIDGEGKAQLQLQATLINELADLENTTVHLVIGVPSFYFKDTLDPMALQQSLAGLSQYFQGAADPNQRRSVLASNFDNSLMTQVARMGDYSQTAPASSGQPEGLPGGGREDLFVFTVKNVSLRRGERMVTTLSETTLSYRDVYRLEIPAAPPLEMYNNGHSVRPDLAKLFSAPKVMHKLRLENKTAVPLTTAPALIVRQGKILAQSMMTYTAAGASTDLAVTTAVDIQVSKKEEETSRVPNAVQHNNSHFSRINLAGELSLVNHRRENIEVEVVRYVFGQLTETTRDGKIQKVNVFEDRESMGTSEAGYWNHYQWPGWWHRFNGAGRVDWKTTIKPGETITFGYQWHYFWN